MAQISSSHHMGAAAGPIKNKDEKKKAVHTPAGISQDYAAPKNSNAPRSPFYLIPDAKVAAILSTTEQGQSLLESFSNIGQSFNHVLSSYDGGDDLQDVMSELQNAYQILKTAENPTEVWKEQAQTSLRAEANKISDLFESWIAIARDHADSIVAVGSLNTRQQHQLSTVWPQQIRALVRLQKISKPLVAGSQLWEDIDNSLTRTITELSRIVNQTMLAIQEAASLASASVSSGQGGVAAGLPKQKEEKKRAIYMPAAGAAHAASMGLGGSGSSLFSGKPEAKVAAVLSSTKQGQLLLQSLKKIQEFHQSILTESENPLLTSAARYDSIQTTMRELMSELRRAYNLQKKAENPTEAWQEQARASLVAEAGKISTLVASWVAAAKAKATEITAAVDELSPAQQDQMSVVWPKQIGILTEMQALSQSLMSESEFWEHHINNKLKPALDELRQIAHDTTQALNPGAADIAIPGGEPPAAAAAAVMK